MVKQLSALADVLGANGAAAINFDDHAAGDEVLASLERQQSIDAACLFDARDRVFASYARLGGNFKAPGNFPAIGHEFLPGGFLDIAQPIVFNRKRIGTIYLHASMAEIRDQIAGYVGIVVSVMAISVGAVLALSMRLQRAISLPILSLAATAKRISQQRDFSIRVHTNAADEIGTLYTQFNDMLERIQEGEQALQEAHDLLEANVIERTRQLSEAIAGLNSEVAVRTRAEAELRRVHQQLMDAARRAGMAEIATGVLHNVGNVLNSINVSASVAGDRLRGARIDQLARVTGLLEEHSNDLGRFITLDPKGKQIPAFLRMLSGHLTEERVEIISELDNLASKIDHVKTIVATQQMYAGVTGVTESFGIAAAVDDALKLDSVAFDRHRIAIVRDYEPMTNVQLDKQKLLQILVNLIKNGKDALVEAKGCAERRLTFRTRKVGANRVQIQVADNGVGVMPENLTRIFSHGFTTKTSGHGFGLHSCANAANELGGTLAVHSDGAGKGATFTLELPSIGKGETLL